jgi:hypothetical protein
LLTRCATQQASYPSGWIEEAIQLAVKNNVRRWNIRRGYFETLAGGRKRWSQSERQSGRLPTLPQGRIWKIRTTLKRKESPAEKPQDVCPICGGIGYVRRNLPVDDPNFGILEVCQCQKENFQRASVQRLYQISNLQAFKDMTLRTSTSAVTITRDRSTRPWNSLSTLLRITPTT